MPAKTKSKASGIKATRKIKKPTATKARQPVKKVTAPNALFKGQRHNIRRKVVSLRDKKQKSWGEIGAEIGVAPKTVRRLYDEVQGEGAHHGRLEGKGGRTVGS